MLQFLKREANKTQTENGAAAYRTTDSDCVDLFAVIGALRNQKEEQIMERFARAYAENPDMAMKILFFARDVRGGLGERRSFRVILRWLAFHNARSVRKNISFICEYGRYDDLLVLLDTPCEAEALSYIQSQLNADLDALEKSGKVSLLAKWLPSVNASSPETVRRAKKIARSLGMNDQQYRKSLVRLRSEIRIIENNLREKDYTFDYAKQPSRAMLKYRKAFFRNDRSRYEAFLEQVRNGAATLHTGTLTPYDIITPFFRENTAEDERRSIDVTWNAQEDFTRGENALVVADGSASMYYGSNTLPAAVAISLAIYFGERNEGPFKNHFITFSHKPQLVEIKGRTIYEKVVYCTGFNEVANTDIQKVFELVLKTAVKNRLPQKELPETIYIISDMEFDSCTENAQMTNFEYAKRMFSKHGYALPRLVFWNVDSRNRQQPVKLNEQGAALVSGCSPRIFSMISSGNLTPYAYMMEVLNSERYDRITA
ncbi:DUF2828 domain-containing protein [Anaerovorax odorimutans]|uniref:DUF2828 domain-containing protein n=1 Tax=Anaerovorax odorimutans TaxID=109327 RepID=A0ABT1RR88_9FIRM|nr:DUF2828 family protein [Anaerovorax odorimutans]MCQ4637710.1 DUF2828 domain-containing protein [Anaerovorax odorimutans]